MKLLDWLFASRYAKSLELFHMEQRQDFLAWLEEKDAVIRQLRVEIAALRAVPVAAVMPKKPVVSVPVPEVVSQDWQGELQKLIQEEEDGLRSGGRVQEHESRANDGAQAQHGAKESNWGRRNEG